MLYLGNIERFFYDLASLDLKDAVVLDDLHPALEKLYVDQALLWRRNSRRLVRENFVENDMILSR